MAEEEKTEAPAAEEVGEAKEETPEAKAPEAKEVPAAEAAAAPEAKEAPAAKEESAPAAEAAPEAEAAAEPETEAAPEAAPAEDLPKFTAKEIDKMNVPKLKEAALSYTGKIAGVHGMDKSQLIRSLKVINDLPLLEAKKASKIDRQAIKQKIKAYKSERDGAIKDYDKGKLKRIRNRTKALRRKLVRNA